VNTWKVIFATMVIFGTGVVTGGLLVRNSQHTQFQPPQRTNNPPRQFQPNYAGGVRVEFLRRAERELDLTPDQRERIDKIIAASQERTKKIMEPVTPLMREEIKRTKEEFREALTPEQRQRFDELLKQQQRPRDQHRPNAPRDRAPDGKLSPAG
jgi:Spy/CpxP family protein refolding chaperone